MANTETPVDFERGVIGALLSAAALDDQGAARIMGIYARKGVNEKWFRNSRWKRLWNAIDAEWNEHHAVDSMLAADRFGEGGAAAVAEALEAVPSASYAEYYCDKLRDVYIYAKTHALCMQTIQQVRPNDIATSLDELSKGVREIQGLWSQTAGGLSHVDELTKSVTDEMQLLSDKRYKEHDNRFFIGLPMPWDFLNQYYMGLKPGLHIIAALPSQGKTTMGVAISLFWCQRNIKHGFVCIDMTAKELVKRYGTLSSQVSLSKLNWGASPEDVRRFSEACKQECLKNVEISESDLVERIRDEAYRGVYTHGWQAMIIDYLQLVQDDFKGRTATYEQVKQVTQEIKRLSKDLKLPIVCLVQLARAAAKEFRETNRRPGLEDLGDSAEIARAASTVAVLAGDQNTIKFWKESPPYGLAFSGSWRDENGELHTSMAQEYLAKRLRPVWYYLIKNQQGPTGEVPFVMFPNYFMFRPGNPEAEDEVVTVDGKERRCAHLKFERLRDDWMRPDSDEILEKTGVMLQRGFAKTEGNC